jgi:hypothetical protein
MVFVLKIMGKAVRPCANAQGFKFERVQHRPQLEPLHDIGRFFASLRFDQKGKLEQLGIEIGSFD